MRVEAEAARLNLRVRDVPSMPNIKQVFVPVGMHGAVMIGVIKRRKTKTRYSYTPEFGTSNIGRTTGNARPSWAAAIRDFAIQEPSDFVTVSDVRKQLAGIKEQVAKRDFESAMTKTDELYVSVLKSYAAGDRDPRVAKTALQAEDLEYPRW